MASYGGGGGSGGGMESVKPVVGIYSSKESSVMIEESVVSFAVLEPLQADSVTSEVARPTILTNFPACWRSLSLFSIYRTSDSHFGQVPLQKPVWVHGVGA